MANLKHVGRQKNNKRRCVVVYRTLPNDPYSCLISYADTLPADEHDGVMKVVESHSGQSAYELAEALHRNRFADGRNILQGLHKTGKLVKMSTSEIEMTPDTRSVIGLDELNNLIAEQRGVSLEDLPLGSQTDKKQSSESDTVASVQETAVEAVQEANTASTEPLSDEELAKQLRSQADAMFKEAKRLREQAEELVPIKRNTKKKESVEKE